MYLTTDIVLMHKLYQHLKSFWNCWEFCVPVGPFISMGTAFLLLKSKGPEFPCIPTGIKYWKDQNKKVSRFQR